MAFKRKPVDCSVCDQTFHLHAKEEASRFDLRTVTAGSVWKACDTAKNAAIFGGDVVAGEIALVLRDAFHDEEADFAFVTILYRGNVVIENAFWFVMEFEKDEG